MGKESSVSGGERRRAARRGADRSGAIGALVMRLDSALLLAGAGKAGRLTPKEREIVVLITEGLADKEISRRLNISVNTVHAHRNNISRKLDIHKQTDLVRFAIQERLVRV
jgi:DNA-binding NarL/FixJ family response regulator